MKHPIVGSSDRLTNRSIMLVALLFACLHAALAQTPPPASFAAARSYEIGRNVPSVATGDFNGDGKSDLAATGQGGIAVLLGNGDGTFQTAVIYPAGSNTFSVAVADLNGDGKLDLAATEAVIAGKVYVLLGNGNGTFQTAVGYAVGSADSGLHSIAEGDFDGNGKPDLAVTNESDTPEDNTVSVLLGNGNGTFKAAANYPVGTLPQGLAAGDFNSDGRSDLVVTNSGDDNVSVLLANADGTFNAATTYPVGDFPVAVAIGNFDGDGKLDLAVANGGGTFVSVLLGNGNGSFQAAVNYTAGSSPSAIAATDVDADGKVDLVVGNFNGGTVSVLLGNGNGTFQASTSYAAGSIPFSVAVADFNVDGKPDLAVANLGGGHGGYVTVLIGNGNGTFQTAVYYPTPSTLSVAVGDLNNDGKPDLVAGNVSTVSVLLGNSDGTFQTPVNKPASFMVSVAIGEFNGDGKPDVVGVAGGSSVNLFLGNGDGTLQGALLRNVCTPQPPGRDCPLSHPEGIAVGDFNKDGKMDIAVTTLGGSQGTTVVSPNVTVLLGKGDGTFQPPVGYAVGVQPLSVTVGDLNGDGTPDLTVANGADATVSVLLGNGDGTFQTSVSYAAGPATDSATESIQIEDLNADGKVDLAVANLDEDGNVFVLLGNGNGTFQTAVGFPTGSPANGLVSGDFNGDGKPDLTVTNFGGVTLLLGFGDGTFYRGKSYAAASFPNNPGYTIVKGDFNADGKLDAAVATPTGLTVFLNTTKYIVPDVVGETQSTATLDIESAGLVVGQITFASSTTVPAGSVISESPTAGTEVNLGASVDLVIASATPFASVAPKLTISTGAVSPPGFDLKIAFTLASNDSAIFPLSQPVTLTVGSYTVTVPASAFKQLGKGAKTGGYVYTGTVNGVTLSEQLSQTGTNSYSLQVSATGVAPATSNPVAVTLTIGTDFGTASVIAKIQ